MKKREGSRLIEERKDGEGNLLCLIPICNNLREKYKKSNKLRNYCEKHGWEDMREFTSWQGLREKVFKRDNYSCVKCGDDRREIEINTKEKRMVGSDGEKVIYKEVEVCYMRSNFIGDHIVPIALGGKEFDIDNVQTLCLNCNKEKTSIDIKEISIQRELKKNKQKTLNLQKCKSL